MKTFDRRHFLKTAAATAAVASAPFRSPAPATLMEGAAALCVVLTVAAAGITCVVRLCRPRYFLYLSVDENRTSNGGREYLCLACSRAESQQRELRKCEGPFLDLAACQTKAAIGNTNYLAFSCGPVATAPEPPLRASITVQSTHDDPGTSAAVWANAAPAQTMDLNDQDTDDPSVTFTFPLSDKPTFFRASALAI